VEQTLGSSKIVVQLKAKIPQEVIQDKSKLLERLRVETTSEE